MSQTACQRRRFPVPLRRPPTPLCTFGCDYLYEQCHVTVCDGAVVAGNPAAGSTEAGVVAALVGRVVDPRWTGAPTAYFDNVNLGGRGRVPDKEAVTTE